MKILFIRRDNIGDLVCTTPLIAALRERFLPLEDLRDRHSALRVLHAAVGLRLARPAPGTAIVAPSDSRKRAWLRQPKGSTSTGSGAAAAGRSP